MKKVRFWDEDETSQSSKRLVFLSGSAFAILASGAYLIKTWDYAGTIALFSGIMTPLIAIMGIGKKQENDRAKNGK